MIDATGHVERPIDYVGRIIKCRIQEATLSRNINPCSTEEFFHITKNICKRKLSIYFRNYGWEKITCAHEKGAIFFLFQV